MGPWELSRPSKEWPLLSGGGRQPLSARNVAAQPCLCVFPNRPQVCTV